MPSLYPPVLETKARAIPSVTKEQNSGYYFDIEFQMPTMNSLNDIGHIQVSIKNQATNEAAVNPANSPDRQVLYIKRNEGTPYFFRKDNGNYVIHIPYYCFAGETPQKGTTYCVQVRFGVDSFLWDTSTNGINGLGAVGAFAQWKQTQTNAIPSGFGEWSNVMTVYCHGAATETLEYNLDDFVPEVVYSYTPESGQDDPLEQVKVVYSYNDLYGTTTGTEVFNGTYQQDGSYSIRAKLPLAPVQQILVSVEAVTKNNTIRGKTISILPLKNTGDLKVIGGSMKTTELRAEEADDGVIAKTFILSPNTPSDLKENSYISVYRCELYTLKTVKIIEKLEAIVTDEITFKDFTVEMGEEYQYVLGIKDMNGKCYGLVTDIYDWGYENPGYGRLMKMDSIFLTTKNHQLRLTGGVSISSYKKNTQDSFQTTIGSKYPFYSRNSQMNYKTLSLTALVTINFDPTGTFLRNDTENGLWWDDANGSKLVILNKDLYGEQQISLSRRRMRSGDGTYQITSGQEPYDITRVNNDKYAAHDVYGPNTIYDPYLYRNINRVVSTDLNDQMVYLERKFRECVMEWLSDGKPKLFRSETEGNMIVMLSAITFTPQGQSNRMVYSMTATVTEIAEASLENLINYDLVPVEITSHIISNFPRDLRLNDLISNEDYLTLIALDKTLTEYFERSGIEWRVKIADKKSLMKLNEIVRSIGDYTFIRGDEDPSVYYGLIYQYNKIYDIPNSIAGQKIKDIDTRSAVLNGSGSYDFSIIDGLLPEGLTFINGIISGTPKQQSLEPQPAGTLTLQVIDKKNNNPKTNTAVMQINVGIIYSELFFEKIKYVIPMSTIGVQISPVRLSELVSGGVKFSELKDLTEDSNKEEASADFDYMWFAQGLPAGLSINNKGEITGSYLNEARQGTAFITVVDAVGQSKIQPIDFSDGVKQLSFQDSSLYDLYYTEVNVDITPIDVSGGVSGGFPSTNKEKYPRGYKFSAIGLPPGISIDEKTGIISGHPTMAMSAGTATIQATDFGETPTTASIQIIYQEVLPEFKFTYDPRLDIDPYGNDSSMNLGLVIDPIKVQELNKEAVTGGLKFSDPPYYRFSSENLIPDFEIDNDGVITGRASVASPKRTAKLFVTDARGKTIKISQDITIVEILARLTFNPSKDYSLPVTFVGTTDPNYRIVIPMTDLSQGVPPYSAKLGPEWPTGMDINPVTNPDGSVDFVISGSPENSQLSTEATVIFTDRSPEKETIHYKIPIGQVVEPLSWNQNVDDIGQWSPARFEIGEQTTFYIKEVKGGLQPYTLKCLNPDDMGPMVIYQSQAGEQEATKIYISGIPNSEWPGQGKTLSLVLTDKLGQSIEKTMTIGTAQEALTLTMENDLKDKKLISGKSHISNMPIMKISGGDATATKKYYYQDESQTLIFPNVYLNQNNGTINGDVVRTNAQMTDIGKDFYGQQGNRRILSKTSWYVPVILPEPSRGVGIGGSYTVRKLTIGETFNEVRLIQDNKYDGQIWEVDGEIPPGFYFRDGILGGTPTASFNPCSITCRLRVPKIQINEWCYTDESSIYVEVKFEGAFGILSWSPAMTQISGLEVGVPMQEFELSQNLTGGQDPLIWKLSDNAPTWLKIRREQEGRTVHLYGTPAKSEPTGLNFSATVTDAQGESITKDFRISPFYDQLIFKDDPRMDIPERKGGESIPSFDILNAGLVTGGTGSYEFSGVGLSPYEISIEGVISGTASNTSQAAKTAIITVTDKNTKIAKSVEITIGQIIGELSYTHDTSRDIPTGKINVAGTVDFSKGVIGGNTPRYEIVSYPADIQGSTTKWQDTNLVLDKNTGILTYTRPAEATEATSFSLRVYDENGSGETVTTVQIGEVTA